MEDVLKGLIEVNKQCTFFFRTDNTHTNNIVNIVGYPRQIFYSDWGDPDVLGIKATNDPDSTTYYIKIQDIYFIQD